MRKEEAAKPPDAKNPGYHGGQGPVPASMPLPATPGEQPVTAKEGEGDAG